MPCRNPLGALGFGGVGSRVLMLLLLTLLLDKSFTDCDVGGAAAAEARHLWKHLLERMEDVFFRLLDNIMGGG